jgi:hypothetical protein
MGDTRQELVAVVQTCIRRLTESDWPMGVPAEHFAEHLDRLRNYASGLDRATPEWGRDQSGRQDRDATSPPGVGGRPPYSGCA